MDLFSVVLSGQSAVLMSSEFDTILDYDDTNLVRASFRNFLDNSEEILWIGKPRYIFSITPLELGGYDLILGPTNLFFIALGAAWYYSYTFYFSQNYFLSVLLFIIGFLIFSIPDIIKEIRRRNTMYAFTNRRVLFRLWGIWKQVYIKQIDMESIVDLRYEKYTDKPGVLYFILSSNPDFKTYDFSAGQSRHHPTFEEIENVENVYQQIMEIKKVLEQSIDES